jgi:4-hydroxy-3-polyprenylbenzoate decarboxylase
MVSVTEMGAIVCPPVPAFYQRPQTVADIVDHSVARVLDLLDRRAPHPGAALAGLPAPLATAPNYQFHSCLRLSIKR